jgi:exopolysaccharide production protein ExoQ
MNYQPYTVGSPNVPRQTGAWDANEQFNDYIKANSRMSEMSKTPGSVYSLGSFPTEASVDTSADANRRKRVSTASMCSIRVSEAAPTFDICLIAPILTCAYSLIIGPMLLFVFPGTDITTPRLENKIVGPAVFAIAFVCLAFRNRSRLVCPPHIVWFAAYFALAGASILWSFKPQFSFVRFFTEIMMVVSVMPILVANRKADMIRGVFLLFAVGSILNAAMILDGYSSQTMSMGTPIGYRGYFAGKGELGEFAAFAFLFSLYEILRPGWRRVLGLIIVIISVYLILVSESKGSLGCSILAVLLATLALWIGKKMRVSPAMVLLALPISYAVLDLMVGNLINRISWYVYHNYTLSGRTVIWDVVNIEIAKKPLLGWGYRSIWLVGPDSPIMVDAWNWVRTMPSAHNGYKDTMLDTGYVGLVMVIVVIFTTLRAIGRVTDRDPRRAGLLLSVALYIILQNFLESALMQGGDPLWLMFVIVAAEAARYWQPLLRGLGAARPVVRKPTIAERRLAAARAGGAGWLPRRPDVST